MKREKAHRQWKMRGFAALLAAVLVAGSACPVWADGETEIVIYHTNDTHGSLEGGNSSVSIGQVAALKKNTPGSILVDAGDATQGMPLASLTQGKDIITLMNLASYDVMAAGNHEFDFGADRLLANAELADFPILAANVYRDGQPLLEGTSEGGQRLSYDCGERRRAGGLFRPDHHGNRHIHHALRNRRAGIPG